MTIKKQKSLIAIVALWMLIVGVPLPMIIIWAAGSWWLLKQFTSE